MKTFEKLARSDILKKIEHELDVMQFAYRPNRGVPQSLNLISFLTQVTPAPGNNMILHNNDLLPGTTKNKGSIFSKTR